MLMLFVLPCNVIIETVLEPIAAAIVPEIYHIWYRYGTLSNPLCFYVCVEGHSVCCLCLKMNRWKKLAKPLKVSILPQITDVQGKGSMQFCHLSLPSASGPVAVRIFPVECGLSATDCAHSYFTFCCTYVSQGCDSAVHNPIPGCGGVQYDCTQGQKLRFIVYLSASPYGIHIKPESMLTRFQTLYSTQSLKYTECLCNLCTIVEASVTVQYLLCLFKRNQACVK